jgi:hypothetical protein
MERGYTKRWRKRWDKGYHKDPVLWIMMDYFIDFATWKDKEFMFTAPRRTPHIVKLKRGDCFFTYAGLAEFLSGRKPNEIQVSRKMVKVRTSFLQKIGFLGHTQGRDYQIVSVLNYDKYNQLEDEQEHTQGHGRDMVGTSKGHGRDITNNIKKDKNIKNKPPYSPPKGMDLKNNGYGWIDADAWDSFVEHRCSIKKPLSKKAAELSLNFLAKNQIDQKQIIETTIMNRWTGLFPVKGFKKDEKGSYTSEDAHKRLREFQRINSL